MLLLLLSNQTSLTPPVDPTWQICENGFINFMECTTGEVAIIENENGPVTFTREENGWI